MIVKALRLHKNGQTQSGIPGHPAAYTRITFDTAAFDDGAGWDYTNSIWRPPAGLVEWVGQIYIINGVSGINSAYVIKMHKNGADTTTGIGSVNHIPFTTVIQFAGMDRSDGNDCYEVKLYAESIEPDGCIVDGNPAHTWFAAKGYFDR